MQGTPLFITNEVRSQARQTLQAFGLNALKQKFLQFDSPAEQDEPDKYSLLGTPVFDTVTFYGNGNNGDISYYDITLQKTVTVPKFTIDIALITVTEYINVVKTNVAGANGTVKQYINIGDYQIEIKGIFTSEIPDTRPSDLIRQLHKITRSTCEVNIACEFLNLFSVNCIVFDGEQRFSMEESSRDVQKFELNCISETPFPVKVTQQGSTTSSNKLLAANQRFF